MRDVQQIKFDRAALARTFPACFMPNGSNMKQPLKIGIRYDLMQRPVRDDKGELIPVNRLIAALKDYCWGPKYQRALIAGGERIDLDGKGTGPVSEEHRKGAEIILKNILAQAAAAKMKKAA